jgi:WhiB family redox-sensing transcriptional regulator
MSRATSTAGRAYDWRDDATCRGMDGELFFPVGNSGAYLLQIEEAKAVCRRCPVMETCAQWALDTRQPAGVWGGLSETERARALKRRGRPKPPEPVVLPRENKPACGTEIGYQRHWRLREPVDDDCRLAHNAHVRKYSRAVRQAVP